MFQWKRLFLGGAARLQQSSGTERRNSLFFRGSAQGTLGRVNLFANVEIGNDMANATVFATNAYSTTVAGMSTRIGHDWDLQVEVFRNRQNMALNPESIFVLQGGGVPLAGDLSALMQWSLFFRLTKRLTWGGGLPSEAIDQYVAKAIPLAGTVDGVVRSRTLAGAAPVSGIVVSLDGGRTATTSEAGIYHFADVPEGAHDVSLAAADLPADLDPITPGSTRVLVQPRRVARADFEVTPLSFFEGHVTGPEKATLEGILIRLLPGDRYTTTSADGRFAFHNVREGDYNVVLDPQSLPPGGRISSPSSIPQLIRAGVPAPEVEFQFLVVSTEKPIRKVLELQ
jgi:hypothetical protein